jgi:hypothetical protein
MQPNMTIRKNAIGCNRDSDCLPRLILCLSNNYLFILFFNEDKKRMIVLQRNVRCVCFNRRAMKVDL